MSPLEIFAAVITAYSVWLTARENIWCWPTGIVSVILYAWIFWQARLYANAGLQVLYLVLCFYGWYEWLHGGKNRGELDVSRMPLRGWIATIGAGAVAALLTGWAMKRWTDASMPYSDAATTAFSVAAEAMTTRKWIENWLFWIVIDGVTTWMLTVQKLYPSAVLYASFLVLAVIGWIEWKKSLKRAASAVSV
ncbi:MAG TPA: nicotinamide riboside transporter PnuC [Thermoanaerobaculia bacterium]|nr:nicotinamide riboside transporter PnuC [Thermoanaerobaculia bacterium]